MSTTYNYNPIPPRAWSRVQTRCTYTDPSSNYTSAYIPLTNQTVSLAQADYQDKLLYKGNILQYKGNSSQLTKKQKYSQLTKGLGPNRTKVFATQSETYTNPNTTGLLRVNTITYPFPNQIVGKPNNISGPFQYNVPNPSNCPTTTVEDGGNLVCGTYANPCSKEIIKSGKPRPLCFLNTCSDVPGRPIELCWNPKVQTWFPRQRYFMNNSTNKWPEGYKGFVSALRPEAPTLNLIAYTDTSITLSWNNVSNKCIPISSYNIYQDGRIVQNVSYNVTSTTVSGLNPQDVNFFYVTSLSNTIESGPSNSVVNNYITSGTNYYTKTTYNGITYHTVTFTGNGTMTFLTNNITNMQIICVGGGGGGGGSLNFGGGGGGGQIINDNFNFAKDITYVIIVGSGGIGGTNQINGSSGTISQINSNNTNIFTSKGGQGGFASGNGGSSGSGSQGGLNGGLNSDNNAPPGGGGGGGNGNILGNGGNGSLNINVPLYGTAFGAGGGGGVSAFQSGGLGGNLNAGNGAGNGNIGGSGNSNTGCGGGGSGNGSGGSYTGGNGGSGVVIFFWPV